MKFISLQSAKNLSPGKIVFIETADGQRREAKLIERTENENGIKHVFETPAYFNEKSPAIKAVLISDVSKVCVPKSGNGNKA